MKIYDTDIYVSLAGSIAFFIAAFISLKQFNKNKGKVLFFFLLTWMFNGVFFLLDAIGIALRSELIFKIQYSIFYPLQFTFWTAFIDYATTDSIGWKKISIAIGTWVAFFTWLWHPAFTITIVDTPLPDGTLLIDYIIPLEIEIVFRILLDAYTLLFALFMFYWNYLTYRAVPKSMKKDAMVMFLSGILLVVAAVLLFFGDFELIDNTLSFFLMYIAMLTSVFLSTIVIHRNPKITYILPYSVYRILVTSKGGTPYIEYNWSEHEVNTTLLAGLFSAISMMAKGTLDKIETGRIKEVNFQNAIFLTETTYSPVNIGLLASKSSKDLRAGLSNFSSEFVKFYSKFLYNDDGLPAEFVDAQNVFKKEDYLELLNKHFGNVPRFVQQENKSQ